MHTRGETSPRHPGDVLHVSHATVGVGQVRAHSTIHFIKICLKSMKITKCHGFPRISKNSPKFPKSSKFPKSGFCWDSQFPTDPGSSPDLGMVGAYMKHDFLLGNRYLNGQNPKIFRLRRPKNRKPNLPLTKK